MQDDDECSVSARAVAALAMVMALLAGCGQKGPLTLPGVPAERPAASTQPASAPAAGTQPAPRP